MSFKAQQWALEQDDVKGLDKWVLFILAYRDNHDEPHGCFPSQKRMALDCGVSRSTINKCLLKLERFGKIHRQRRSANSTRYSFPQVWDVRITDTPSPRHGQRAVSITDTNHKRTKIEPKPRVQTRDARNRFDDEIEQRRKIAAMAKRLADEKDLRVAINAGAGPR